mgnify:CR=1 FL=1
MPRPSTVLRHTLYERLRNSYMRYSLEHLAQVGLLREHLKELVVAHHTVTVAVHQLWGQRSKSGHRKDRYSTSQGMNAIRAALRSRLDALQGAWG